MKVKSVPVKFKAGPDDGLAEGEFLVYPSTFTRQPDSYGDVVKAGAFTADIAARKEAGTVLPGLYGHRMDDPDFFIASAMDEGEDEHGWWVKGAFDMDSPKAAQVYRLVKGRRLNQLSFAYDVEDEGQVELGDGMKANELRQLKVHEFSFVPVGANQDTSVVAVKDVTAALLDGVKQGRVLAQKHIDSLRSAHEAIGAVITAAEGSNTDNTTDPEKASGTGQAKDEEPAEKAEAKPEEPRRSPSVKTWATEIEIAEKEGS